MKITTAIVIAGGRGDRLRSADINDNQELSYPKPMIRVLGKPILQYVVEWLTKQGIKKIIIGVAYKKEAVINYFKDGEGFGAEIVYSEHDVNDGTGDAFRKAIENSGLKEKYFFAMNGDQFTDASLKDLVEFHFKSEPYPSATILAVHPTSPFGKIEVDKNGCITNFIEKPVIKDPTNAGIYLFDMSIKDILRGNVEKDTFVKLTRKKAIKSFIHNGFFETINNLKDLIRVEEKLKNDEYLRKYFNVKV